MDERIIDAPAATQRAAGMPDTSTAADSRVVSVNGAEVRIDGAHQSSVIGEAPIPVTPARTRATSLIEAGRILEQLQEQDAELTQRESLLERQISQFQMEQQRLRSILAAEQDHLDQQRQKLKSDETALAQQLIQAQGLLAKIDAERISVDEQRQEIEKERAGLRDQLITELAQDRDAVNVEKETVALELQRAQSLTAALDERLRQTTEKAEQLIQAERERLWQALILEWDQRRTQFQQEHDAWLAAVQTEKVEIEREKAFYEAAVRNSETEFTESQRAQEAELQSMREQQIATLQAERAEILEKIQREKEEWERTLVEQHGQLEVERHDFANLRSTQLSEIQNERAVLENRIRFQQEHLEKLRSELERAQNEHRRDRQIDRQRLEEDSQQMVRRLRHIDLYRSSIDEREKSLDREREVLEKSRRAFSSTVDQDRLKLQQEQSAWKAEQQMQQSELLRQQELYTSHAESLESRRIRLERLRTELEDTHRSTLEMRLAIEEAWVDLTQHAGQEAARQRVEQVRDTLVNYYRQLHEGLVEQRREHLESQTKFERQRAEFHDERQKLMEWISARDQELRVGEERLHIAANDAAMHDSAWQTARERWMQEKGEAEQVIRKLLAQLGGLHRDPLSLLPETSTLSHLKLQLDDAKPAPPVLHVRLD